MVHEYQGEFGYDKPTVENWKYSLTGVYYIGSRSASGSFAGIHYVGRATGDGGIRTRLLQHLAEDKWPDCTVFGYKKCDSAAEAEAHETAEIRRLQPKYNKVGKYA